MLVLIGKYMDFKHTLPNTYFLFDTYEPMLK